MPTLCNQCPRACRVDRNQAVGFCGAPARFLVARASLHAWEEPVISGKNGSGTVFFSGCNLRCVFCQNATVSQAVRGTELDEDQLERLMLALQKKGAHNINLVTPSHYAHALVPVLRRVKPLLSIPVVYNCGGYESTEALAALEGLVDIWLPDMKYYSAELSARYSAASDYYPVALRALTEMLRQCPAPIYGEDGLLKKGVIVRHLVLPAARHDSIELLRCLAAQFGSDAFLLSLMSQYTPEFAKSSPYRELHRRVTAFEYDSVLQVATELGFDGFLQDRASATQGYTPNFEEDTLSELLIPNSCS